MRGPLRSWLFLVQLQPPDCDIFMNVQAPTFDLEMNATM
jgi:hypothetical protein